MVIYPVDRPNTLTDSRPISEYETASISDTAMEQLFTTMLDSDDGMLIFVDEI